MFERFGKIGERPRSCTTCNKVCKLAPLTASWLGSWCQLLEKTVSFKGQIPRSSSNTSQDSLSLGVKSSSNAGCTLHVWVIILSKILMQVYVCAADNCDAGALSPGCVTLSASADFSGPSSFD